MNLTNILNALTYLPNTIRIYTDWNMAQAEWKRIGGFNAGTGELVDFVGGYSVHGMEYATWTRISWDDEIAKAIHFILINHRETVVELIELVRQDKEPDAEKITQIAASVGSIEKAGSPMTAIYVLSTIFQILQYLKSQQEGTTQTIETSRPVLTFVKKIFGKR